MAEDFVPLATLLRRRDEPQATPQQPAGLTHRVRERAEAACEPIVAELALLRLAALEAFDRARGKLLESLARDVLARELMLAPADLDALAARALQVFAESEPVALLIAPADAERVSSPLPVRVEPSLSAGDLVVVVRDGEIDARFALRLAEAAQVEVT